MSQKEHHRHLHRTRGVKVVQGMFKPNGAGSIDNTVNVGLGFTVARSDVGLYTVTIDGAYYKQVGGQAFLIRAASPAGGFTLRQTGRATSSTTTGTTTVALQYEAGDGAGAFTATDLAAATETWITFSFSFLDSEVR